MLCIVLHEKYQRLVCCLIPPDDRLDDLVRLFQNALLTMQVSFLPSFMYPLNINIYRLVLQPGMPG